MRKVLIATHGDFATGIKSSAEIIIGRMENVYCLDAYSNGNKGIENELERYFQQMGETDELLIFTDIVNGSVTNQILRYLASHDRPNKNIHLISGLNLPLLLEFLLLDSEKEVGDMIESIIVGARDQIVYVNKLVSGQKEVEDND